MSGAGSSSISWVKEAAVSGLSGALNIGKLALAAQQYAMQVTGNNIANVNTKGYTRQRAVQSTTGSVQVGGSLLIGTGVTVDLIQRIRDELLDIHIRGENGSLGNWTVKANTLEQLESVFGETSAESLGDLMSEFWNSWYDLSNDPENPIAKSSVRNQGSMLASRFNFLADKMSGMRREIDASVGTIVDRINSLSENIAELNSQILGFEGGGAQKANDYRDQRDVALDELSRLVNISYTEMEGGTVSVYISGSLLLSTETRRELATSANAEGFSDVVWSDTSAAVGLNDGELYGLIQSRDTIIPKFADRIDSLANALIENVNRLHSRGMGGALHTNLTSDNAVSDPAAALDSAGLTFAPVDGTFTIAVYDSSGSFVEEQSITVDADTDSLNDIRDAINAAFVGTGNVSASVNASNMLVLTASGSNSFSFVSSAGVGDSSDLLLALGMNTFFSGSDASGIAVNQVIVSDPAKIASGRSTAPGDNTTALAIADLRNSLLMSGGAESLNNYYETTVGTLGADSEEARQMRTNVELVSRTYENQRQAYSGVSLDEEMTEMLRYQHAYNAAARFIATINELMDVLLSMT